MSKHNEIVLDHTGYVGHGNTSAAWACIALLTVGFLLATVGFTLPVMMLMWVGLGVMVLGLVVGFIMKKMGMGYEGEAKRAAERGLIHD